MKRLLLNPGKTNILELMNTKPNIGFIGTGNIGNPMAEQVLSSFKALKVCDSNPAAVKNLVQLGADFIESPKKLASDCDIILLSLPGPDQVKSVMNEIFAVALPKTIVLDLTTNSVDSVKNIEKQSLAKDISYLDVPVSGGAHGAKAGTLTAMASGNKEIFETVRPVLSAFASNIVYLGAETGTATIVKLVNNQLLFCTQVLYAEGLVLAAKSGLDPKRVHEIIQTCSAAPFTSMGTFFLSRDFEAPIFSTLLADKDVSMALRSAKELGVSMPATEAAGLLYKRGVEKDGGARNFFSIIELLEKDANLDL